MANFLIVLFTLIIVVSILFARRKKKPTGVSKTHEGTVTINVTGCGCGSNGRPVIYGSFRIPDTGNAAINCRIAHRVMAKKHGQQYECRAYDTCDYHWAFGPEPVGKWTGNERKVEDDVAEQVRVRLTEIDARLREEIQPHERQELVGERDALKAWLAAEEA